MPRTKQTARCSGYGKAPRRSHAATNQKQGEEK